MLRFYGPEPPYQLGKLRVGCKCPSCGDGSRFTLVSQPDWSVVQRDKMNRVVAAYSCELCLAPIAVEWTVANASQQSVSGWKVITPVMAEFDFEHVEPEIKTEIEEALKCLSVGAYNGFATCCRRAVQAICTDLGAKESSKVKKQIEEVADVIKLDEDTKNVAFEVMLTGHDGAHPHLPEVNKKRAEVLLRLLQDLTYQLYTRQKKVKESKELRTQTIADSKS